MLSVHELSSPQTHGDLEGDTAQIHYSILSAEKVKTTTDESTSISQRCLLSTGSKVTAVAKYCLSCRGHEKNKVREEEREKMQKS